MSSDSECMTRGRAVGVGMGMGVSLVRRVLSVQSHVVTGYVGNRAAVFPLQLLGFDVDFVNSVQFSNNASYPLTTGLDQVLDSKQLANLLDGLRGNSMDKYSHVLTGYACNESFLAQITTEVKQLKKINPSLLYFCDPVLGDNDNFYVPRGLVNIYKSKVLPVADVVTPNDFELRHLTGEPCTDLENTLHAIDLIHEMGPRVVVLTSISLCEDPNKMTVICSEKGETESSKARIDFVKIPEYFTGTGDLFSALFLAWTDVFPCDLPRACEKTVSTVYQVLNNTVRLKSGGVETKGAVELKLIQSKLVIENPPDLFTAQPIIL